MRTLLVVVGLVLVAASSCTRYTTYRYHAEKIRLANTELVFVVTESVDEEMLVKHPSSIQVWARVSAPAAFSGLSVRDITLTGLESGVVFEFDDALGRSPRPTRTDASTLYSVASFSFPQKPVQVESYLLEATVLLAQGSGTEAVSIPVKVTLMLKEGTDRHWDWFDEEMSV